MHKAGMSSIFDDLFPFVGCSNLDRTFLPLQACCFGGGRWVWNAVAYEEGIKMVSRKSEISRRNFVKGITAAGIGATALAGLSGCSPSNANKDSNSEEDAPTTFDVVETKECDICVIGAGASGLAAAVEAAQDGANIICLESQGVTGGNINGVEGCFGIGSQMQKDLGIEIDPGKTIASELAASQMRASGPGYVDMVHASGENIDWLVENGVQFGGVDVDKGNIMVFHRFPSGHGKEDYAAPMTAKAEDLGVQFLLETKAHTLIKNESGAVTGVYADGDGGTIQINAKAVIVATGGFAQNEELMSGVSENQYFTYGGMEGHDGSGHIMCVDAGARSYSDRSAMLVAFDIEGTPGYYDGGLFAFVLGVAAPYAVWINQDGERFCNEDCAANNAMCMCMPHMSQKETFCILDSSMMEMYSDGNDEIYDQISMGEEAGSIFQADSIKDLADLMGVSSDTMEDTFNEYNEMCKAGSDHNYGKNANALIAFEKAPFYALRISHGMNSTIGSIYTDRSFHALDNDMQPIEGLYVVGVEGAMLWSNLYTINVSGGCNANNVNSGRTAARDAVASLK